MEDDTIFWDRLADMPYVETLLELKARRVELAAEVTAMGGSKKAEIQLTKLNEEIKRVNNVVDRSSWRNAVKTVLGQDAYEACLEWIIKNDFRNPV